MEYARSCPDHRPFSYAHPGADEDVCADPGLVTNYYRGRQEPHLRVGVVMCGSAEVTVLRHRCMRADLDAVHGVAVNVVGEAAIIAHFKIPGRPYLAAWLNACIPAHLCAEKAQERPPPPMKDPGAGPEEQQPDDAPEASSQLVPEAVGARTMRNVNADWLAFVHFAGFSCGRVDGWGVRPLLTSRRTQAYRPGSGAIDRLRSSALPPVPTCTSFLQAGDHVGPSLGAPQEAGSWLP